MKLSRENKYRVKKIFKVILWVVVPYVLIKVPQELLKLPDFAEYSFLLNLIAYIGKTMKEEPDKAKMKLEGI